MAIPDSLKAGLRLPVVVAPMFLISDPALVVAACRSGVIGSFPSLNARTSADYEAWLEVIARDLRPGDAPFAVNLIVARQNTRLAQDLAITVKYRVPLVITSFGADREVVAAVHAYGGLVFHDIASVRHAEIAASAGVDGMIVLTTGAGGHTGALNPFALLNEVRGIYDGALLLAGALSTGRDVAAALMAGADFAYMGTRFIATAEAGVEPAYRDMMVAGGAADVVVTRGLTGTPASFLKSSLSLASLDPVDMARRTTIMDDAERDRTGRPWKDIWSAGQGIGSIRDAPPVDVLVRRLETEYDAAVAGFAQASIR